MTTPGPDPRLDALGIVALGAATREEQADAESWVAGHPDAQAELAALRRVAFLLPFAVPQVEPSPALRARVLAIAGASAPSASSSVRAAPQSFGARHAAWPVWLLAAASALLALGLGVYTWQLRARVGSLEANLNSATIRLANAEAEMRDAGARLVRAQAETSILSAPDLARIDLAGQAKAPTAIARAFWSRAQGLVLTATRLPELPAGRTYQLWVLTDGAPISAGIFQPDASGVASVVFDTPVSLPTPRGMAVSVEPAGGVPAPTGDILLVGTDVAE